LDIKVTLYDKSYYEINSSELAFKIIVSMVFKSGMTTGNSILLEPFIKG